MLLCSDINVHPGPVKFTCCRKSIKSTDVASCSHCKGKLHLKCLKAAYERSTELLYCNICYVEAISQNNSTDTAIFKELTEFATKRGVKILHQNINGLLNKMDPVRILFAKLRKNIHIFGFTETHRSTSVKDVEFEIDGYTIIRKDRKSGIGGGVLFYIREDIEWHRRDDLEVDGIECIWVEIFVKKSKSMLFCTLYKPPDSSKHLDKTFTSKLDEMITMIHHENKETIIAGDLNCNYLEQDDHKNIKDLFHINRFKTNY